MEIVFEKNELASALVALGKLISRTSALEVNRCISIEAHEGWTTFTTGTATENITYKAGCDAEIELNAIVAFDEFKEAVRNCRTRLLSISVMEGTLVIGDKVLTPKTEVNWPQMPEESENIRQLAYYLYTLCERKGRAGEARFYNELMTSWHAIALAGSDPKKAQSKQQDLF